MTLSNVQLAELEAHGPATVQRMLLQGGPGRGASIGGFKCGEITKADIDDWLIKKNIEETELQQGTLRWAKIAALAGIIGVIATLVIGALTIFLAK